MFSVIIFYCPKVLGDLFSVQSFLVVVVAKCSFVSKRSQFDWEIYQLFLVMVKPPRHLHVYLYFVNLVPVSQYHLLVVTYLCRVVSLLVETYVF